MKQNENKTYKMTIETLKHANEITDIQIGTPSLGSKPG